MSCLTSVCQKMLKELNKRPSWRCLRMVNCVSNLVMVCRLAEMRNAIRQDEFHKNKIESDKRHYIGAVQNVILPSSE